jgi:hypothetical protein
MDSNTNNKQESPVNNKPEYPMYNHIMKWASMVFAIIIVSVVIFFILLLFDNYLFDNKLFKTCNNTLKDNEQPEPNTVPPEPNTDSSSNSESQQTVTQPETNVTQPNTNTSQTTISGFNNGPEYFNNDLPNEDIKLEEDGDYSQAIQQMALDKSVVDQHNTYVNERNKVTSTASFQPSRTDTQDIVPFRGLRRPQYSAGGVNLVDETARVVPSELDSDYLAKPTQIYWK